MQHISAIQHVLDIIDERITEKMTVSELAEAVNFSAYHFCRLFLSIIGMPIMLYVTHRKLQYALYDLCRSKKIINVAMDYGYETHAGFTKAFKRCFGYPPSLFRIHAGINPPKRIVLSEFTSHHTLPEVEYTHDIPAYWDKINMECSDPLTRLHNTFTKSKHCEYSVCFNTDLNTGEFTYLLGVGVDSNEDMTKIQQDMHKMDIHPCADSMLCLPHPSLKVSSMLSLFGILGKTSC